MPNDDTAATLTEAAQNKWSSWVMLAVVGAMVIGLAALFIRPSSISADSAVTEHRFDGGSLQWQIEDYPAIVLQGNSFRLALTDAAGEPLRGAELAIKLEMIDMECGDYDFTLTETSPGVYTGEGVPLMAGLWKATHTMDGNEDAVISRTLKAVY